MFVPDILKHHVLETVVVVLYLKLLHEFPSPLSGSPSSRRSSPGTPSSSSVFQASAPVLDLFFEVDGAHFPYSSLL